MKIKKIVSIAAVFSFFGVNAQVTSSPSPLQIDSEDIVVYFHANQGNKQLANLPATTEIYAHTGVITNNSKSDTDWQYAPSWLDNSDKYRLEYVEDNLWSLYIGDIRSYYGITNLNEKVEKLAFVFRNAGGTLEGKTSTGGDIFLDVVDSGLQVIIEASNTNEIITSADPTVEFTVSTTIPANIMMWVDNLLVAEESNTTVLNTTYTFEEPGNYIVDVVAFNDEERVTASRKYCYVGQSVYEPYPGVPAGEAPPMGPVANPDGTVTFCFAAPEKANMMIVGAWNNYALDYNQVMNYTVDENGFKYFWWTSEELDPSTMYGYFFIVDESIKVADPYARLVLDPWNDKYLDTSAFVGLPPYPENSIQNMPLSIYQMNINEYDWQVTDFKGVDPSNLIIYELLFRDFTGTEGKSLGNGTVQQAIEKLPYLKTLGVNAIEVLPIMEFTGNISWGYNPNFYFAVDKAYGTPDDYKEFIDLCHQNGIAVILDMVFNQSDGLHPWYQMYSASENPFYNIPDAPHAYSVLNDWNQGFPLVQQQWADVIKYWMTEYKFDGFRFDLVKGLGDNDSYANDGMAATDAYNQSRIDRMIGFNELVKSINPNAYVINEDLATAREENAMAEYGLLNWANINDPACQFAMGYSSGSDMNRLYAPLDSRIWGSTVSYLESHDEQRLAYKQNQWGFSGVKGNVVNSMHRLGSAAAQMILSPGAHMIWQFSEMGNAENTKTDIGNNVDPKKVDWALLDEPNHKGLYDNYCELIALRNKNQELFAEEGNTFTMECNSNNWGGGRYLYSANSDSTKVLITVINPNTTGVTTFSNVRFPSNVKADYYIASKSYNSSPSFDVSAGTVTVEANCYVTIATENVSEIRDIFSENSNRLIINSAHGEISVESAEGQVSIFTIDGSLVALLSVNERISVSPGIYIARDSKNSLKVLVK